MPTEFTERVIGIIRSIPEGRVMSYGSVARVAGNPGGTRQVVRILHSCSETYDLPWHRVVNSKGITAFREQDRLLREEGVLVSENGEIDLEAYLWDPTQTKCASIRQSHGKP